MRRNVPLLCFFLLSVNACLWGQASKMLDRAKEFSKNGSTDSARSCFTKAVSEAIDEKDPALVCKTYFAFGDFIYYQGQIDESATQYFNALNVARSNRLVKQELLALRDLGWCYRELGRNEQAAQYYYEALSIAFQNKDYKEMAYCHSYIFTMYDVAGKNDSSLVHLHELEKYTKLTGDSDLLYLTNTNYGLYYYDTKNYGEAIRYFDICRRFPRLNNDPQELLQYYNRYGNSLKHLGRVKEGIVYLDSARAYAEQHNDLTQQWYAYLNLSDAYYDAGMYREAMDYLRKYNDINDSIESVDASEKMATMQAKYDVQSREQKIKLLSQAREAEAQKLNFIIGVSVLGFILLVISVFAFFNTRRKNSELRMQKAEIENKTEELNRQAAEIARFRTQMNPHFVFNAVNSLQRFILTNEKEKALAAIADFSSLMRQTLYNSDKSVITLQEEIAFLEKYVLFEQFRFENKFSFRVETAGGIQPDDTFIPPMIIQPLVENAVRHGVVPLTGPGEIVLRFSVEGRTLVVSVRDNGAGRSASEKMKNASSMHESKGTSITRIRVAQFCRMNGADEKDSFVISDLKNANGSAAGTEVILRLPLVSH
ncbi:MAG TPA: histidine kinase [Bacteroidia bacterium]|nr:histidine kinase [Bacteroidia bacterium]